MVVVVVLCVCLVQRQSLAAHRRKNQLRLGEGPNAHQKTKNYLTESRVSEVWKFEIIFVQRLEFNPDLLGTLYVSRQKSSAILFETKIILFHIMD